LVLRPGLISCRILDKSGGTGETGTIGEPGEPGELGRPGEAAGFCGPGELRGIAGPGETDETGGKRGSVLGRTQAGSQTPVPRELNDRFRE